MSHTNILTHTGVENLGIIFEFSPWVLKICPEDGLKVGTHFYTNVIFTNIYSCLKVLFYFLLVQIFTEDLTEVETLPRDKVLQFLKEGFEELAIPYLEHIIYIWDEKGPEFHNVLIQLYLGRVQGLMKEYLNALPEGTSEREPGSLKGFCSDSFFCSVKTVKIDHVLSRFDKKSETYFWFPA